MYSNKVVSNHTPNEANYHFLYYVRKIMPKAHVFYLILVLIKYVSILDLTHYSSLYEKGNLSGELFLRRIYIRNVIPFHTASYKWICASVFVLCFLYYGLVLYARRRLRVVQRKHLLGSKAKDEKRIKEVIKALSYAAIVILFISQHVNEYLFFSAYVLFDHNQGRNERDLVLTSFYEIDFNEKIIILVMNILSFIMIEFSNVFWLYFSKGSSLNPLFGFNGSLNGIYFFQLLILDSSQGLVSIIPHFSNSSRSPFVLCLIQTTLNLILFFFALKKYLRSFMDYLVASLMIFTVLSGLFEILISSFSTKLLTVKQSFAKIVVEVVNTLIVFTLITHFKRKALFKECAMKLFNNYDSPDSKQNGIIAYIDCLNDCIKHPTGLYALSGILLHHSSQCASIKCPCHFIRKKLSASLLTDRTKLIEYYAIVAEQEINGEIIAKSKARDISSDTQEMIILHIDFMLLIKHNYYLSLFLAQSYWNERRSSSYSFKTKYLLFEYKKRIIQLLKATKVYPFQRKNKHFINKESNSLSSKVYGETKQLVSYLFSLEKTRKILLESCNSLIKVILFKNNEMKKGRNKKIQIDSYLVVAQSFEKYDKLLIKELTDRYTISNKLNNQEMCYLITHYYNLIYRIIPREVKEVLGTSLYLNDDMKEESYFSEIRIANPIIITIDNKDHFIIQYISQALCNLLHYRKEQLEHSDFNMLMPKLIGQIHPLHMKLFCFSGIRTMKKNTFYVDEQGRLVNVNIKAKIYPSISDGLSLIISNNFDESKSAPYQSYQARYYFLLNDKMEVQATSESFEEYFFFNQKLLEHLKVSYCGLFNLNQEKVLSYFKSSLDSKVLTKKESIEELNRALSIMSSCQLENIFFYRKKKRLEVNHSASSFTSKTIGAYSIDNALNSLTQTISPIDLFNSVNKIENDMEELGLDSELSYRVMFLKERLRITSEAYVLNKQNKRNEESLIELTLTLKRMNSCNYFIANVKEAIPSMDRVKENFRAYQNRHLQSEYTKASSVKSESSVSFRKSQASNELNSPSTNERQKSCFVSPVSGRMKEKKYSYGKRQLLRMNNSLVDSSNRTSDSQMNSQLRLVPNANAIIQLKEINEQIQKDFSEQFSLSVNHTKQVLFKNTTEEAKPKEAKKGTKSFIHLQNTSNIFLNKSLVYICWILVLTILIVQLVKNLLSSHLLDKSKNLFYIYSYLTIATGDLSFCSLYIISDCLISDTIHPLNSIPDAFLLSYQAKELMSHFYLAKRHASEVRDSSTKAIINAMSARFTISHLLDDFEIKERTTFLWEEIFYFHYLVDSTRINADYAESQECRVRKYFYREKFKRPTEKDITTDKEQLLYYVMYNMLFIIQIQMHTAINTTIEQIFYYNQFTLRSLEALSIISICFVIVLYTSFLIKVLLIRNKIATKMVQLTSTKEEDSLEENLRKFVIVIMNFHQKSIKQYEIDKHKNHYGSLTETTISMLNPNFNSVCAKKMSETKKSLKSRASNIRPISIKSINEKGSDFKDINDTLNPSQSVKVVQPKWISFALIISLLMIAFLSLLIITDLLISSQTFNDFNRQNGIGYNIMQRIPTMVDIAIYYMISVIVNDEYHFSVDEEFYEEEGLSNYYGISLDDNRGTLIVQLKKSYYSFLNHMLQVQRGNVYRFYNDDKANKRLFTQAIDLERSIRNSPDFILQIALKNSSTSFHFGSNGDGATSSLMELFTRVNDYVKEAKSTGNGLNLKGLDPALDLMVQELNNDYLAFYYDEDKDKRNLTKYLSALSIIYTSENCQFILSSVHNIYSHMLLDDIIMYYGKAKSNELGLSLISIFSNVVFFGVMILVVIAKLEKTLDLIDKTEMIIVNAV